jgi:hypothetical protein
MQQEETFSTENVSNFSSSVHADSKNKGRCFGIGMLFMVHSDMIPDNDKMIPSVQN